MHAARLTVTAMLFSVAAVCAEQPRQQPGAVLAIFKQELKAALINGLARGAADAIAACQTEAPAIAARLSDDAIIVGRSSHRLRNPDNAAPPWVASVLAAYVANADARSPRTVALPDGRSGYVEPIMTQAMCVTCHGDRLQPDVAAAIAQRYPADRAVGFKPGDLRGVFWVETAAE